MERPIHQKSGHGDVNFGHAADGLLQGDDELAVFALSINLFRNGAFKSERILPN